MTILRKPLKSTRLRSAIDGAKIAETFERAFAAAGIDSTTGAVRNVSETIRRALSSAGLMANAVAPHESGGDGNTPRAQPRLGLSGELEPSHSVARKPAAQFLSRSYTNAAGTRRYKLYIPASYAGQPTPLIVMLHGCTQDPEDFAAGTRMNEWAEKHGLLVVYPAQSANANGAKCWNWFDPAHQVTDRGEPSLIAGLTREVGSMYAVDMRRIFVAGLSAGAAMAVVLGATYPDLFAGVGAHSGLPYGAANDLPSALGAMRGNGGPRNGSRNPLPETNRTPPTIVFHGDRDATVNCANATAIASGALTVASGFGTPLNKAVQERQSANGGQYTTTIYRDAMMRPHIEVWILHGAGHAWSGGSSEGSYTDVRGPDASAEMLRFFLAQAPPIPESPLGG